MSVLANSKTVAMTWRALDPAPHQIRQLLVLLPNAEINEAQLAHTLWTLAGEHHASVHILALINDWADEAQVRLRVALLIALLHGSGIEPAEHYERDSTDWISIVRRLYQPGDVIVCHAEQTLPLNNGRLPPHFSPLSTHIAMLHMPVCELRGAIKQMPAMTLRRAIRVWGLPLFIIFGSVALEILFMRWARDWVEWSRQSVLLAYTAAEIFMIVWLAKE
jgi:hypothetical protein